MSGGVYTIETTQAIPVSTTTSMTVLSARMSTQEWGMSCRRWGISFDGVTAANTPVLVEFFAGQGLAGTAAALLTPKQVSGRVLALPGGNQGGQNFSVEPGTPVVYWEGTVTPNNGLLIMEYAVGHEPETFPANGGHFNIRCLAAQAVNAQAFIEWERY